MALRKHTSRFDGQRTDCYRLQYQRDYRRCFREDRARGMSETAYVEEALRLKFKEDEIDLFFVFNAFRRDAQRVPSGRQSATPEK
jgi:hypothetical protein